MVDVPAATPVTTPPATVATAVLVLLHTPPPVASVSVIVLPEHTTGAAGNIATGAVFTVATVVAEHPAFVYEIVEVPTPAPVTSPAVEIVATVVVALLHTPPTVPSVKVTVPPRHIVTGTAAIAAGVALTVIIVVETHVPIA